MEYTTKYISNNLTKINDTNYSFIITGNDFSNVDIIEKIQIKSNGKIKKITLNFSRTYELYDLKNENNIYTIDLTKIFIHETDENLNGLLYGFLRVQYTFYITVFENTELSYYNLKVKNFNNNKLKNIFTTNFESLKYTILQTCKNYVKQSNDYVAYTEPHIIKKIIIESDVDILHILIRENGYCDNFFVNTISDFYKTKNAIYDVDKNLISNYEYVIDTRINCLWFNDLFFSFGMYYLNYIDIKIMYEIELCVICENEMFAFGQKYSS
jgi:hypothetical protein